MAHWCCTIVTFIGFYYFYFKKKDVRVIKVLLLVLELRVFFTIIQIQIDLKTITNVQLVFNICNSNAFIFSIML